MKKFIGITTFFMFAGFASQAAAILYSDIELIDPLIAVADLENSGGDELAFINEVTGIDWNQDALTNAKLSNGFELVEALGNPYYGDLYAMELPSEPSYFYAKFGGGGGVNHTGYDGFIFDNFDNRLYATIILDYQYFNTGPGTILEWGEGEATGIILPSLNLDIDNMAVSHVVPVSVPEPATMLLFGTGLAGLAGVGLRRRKK